MCEVLHVYAEVVRVYAEVVHVYAESLHLYAGVLPCSPRAYAPVRRMFPPAVDICLQKQIITGERSRTASYTRAL